MHQGDEAHKDEEQSQGRQKSTGNPQAVSASSSSAAAASVATAVPNVSESTSEPRRLDISFLVLDDHAVFRRQFARLDLAEREAKEWAEHAVGKTDAARDEGELRSSQSNPGVQKLRSIWKALTLHLEIHADAEEALLYPKLVRAGGKDAADETKDAIGQEEE
jgi:hypothetical protein